MAPSAGVTWLNLPRTLRSVTRPGDFPEVPDDFAGTKTLNPAITVLKVLDENKKIVLQVTLDKITVTDAGPVPGPSCRAGS